MIQSLLGRPAADDGQPDPEVKVDPTIETGQAVPGQENIKAESEVERLANLASKLEKSPSIEVQSRDSLKFSNISINSKGPDNTLDTDIRRRYLLQKIKKFINLCTDSTGKTQV